MNYQAPMTDEKLIQFYLNGNPNALSTLAELYKDRIYSNIYKIVLDKHAAADIFQQVFVTIINNMMAGKTVEEGKFLEWATSIAHSLCVEHCRKTKQSVISDGERVDFSVPMAVNNTLYHDSHGKIKSMIDMLPDQQREVMTLNHYAGLSFASIADIMKCSVSTALDAMKFGLNNLRRLMTEKEVVLQ